MAVSKERKESFMLYTALCIIIIAGSWSLTMFYVLLLWTIVVKANCTIAGKEITVILRLIELFGQMYFRSSKKTATSITRTRRSRRTIGVLGKIIYSIWQSVCICSLLSLSLSQCQFPYRSILRKYIIKCTLFELWLLNNKYGLVSQIHSG